MSKQDSIDGYPFEEVCRVQETCRYIAKHLGELNQHVIVMGGLVPFLIVEGATDRHVGTLDVDLGMIIGHTDHSQLDNTRSKLLALGFVVDSKNEIATRLRYQGVVVDLMCGISSTRDSESHHINPKIAGQVTLAFQDRMDVPMKGRAIDGTNVDCQIGVCGPGAFVLNKALTFHSRRENKDAYDLYYVIQNFGTNPLEIFQRMAPLLSTAEAQAGIKILEQEFLDLDAPGPLAVARFLNKFNDDDIQADVCGAVRKLLEPLGL